MKKHVRFACRALSILVMGMFAFPALTGTAAAFAMESMDSESEVDPNYIPPPVIVSGEFGYQVNEDGTATIAEYRGDDEDLVIPSEIDGYTVTAIGYASLKYLDLRSLTIPDTVKLIGGTAFEYCTITDSLKLPDNIELNYSAFGYVDLPASITIPAGALVHKSAFSYCDTLEQVFIDSGAVLEDSAIGYCDLLDTVVCAEGVRLEEDCVEYCDELQTVILCGGVDYSEESFSYCGEIDYIELDSGEFDSLLQEMNVIVETPKPQAPQEPETKIPGNPILTGTEDGLPKNPVPQIPEDIPVINWEDYIQGGPEDEFSGRFEQFPEYGIELYIPYSFDAVELGSEYDGLFYVGYFTENADTLVPGIAVQFIDVFDFADFEEYRSFVENLGDLAQVHGDFMINGLHCLAYMMPDSNTMVVGTLLDGGVLEVAFMADDADYLMDLADIVGASIREIQETEDKPAAPKRHGFFGSN